MVPAMRAALSDSASDAGYVRQVVFLTDGAIGNEQQLFETISALRGRSRIFMVGIGSAPNTYLMTRAAELGRGTFTHIGSVEQVEERMRGLFSKLENPAVTNLTAKFSDASADITPSAIPDLYRDEPLRLLRRSPLGKLVRLGRDQGPHRRPPLGGDASARQCRRRQGPLEAVGTPQDCGCRGRTHHAAGEPGGCLDKTILALALDHQKTGYAADQPRCGRQDAEPSRGRTAEGLRTTDQPAGRMGLWQKVFGERPRLPAVTDRTSRRCRARRGSMSRP